MGASVLAIAGLAGVWEIMLAAKVFEAGDSPAYIMLAQAMDHGTFHILPTIDYDLAHRVFSTTYQRNATLVDVEHFNGPRGLISPFDPGLPALLTPFVAVFGPVHGGELGMFTINAAGLVWLHQRTSSLFHLDRLAQAVLGIAMAMPAVLVAATQVYPDLPAGILITMAVLEIAAIEIDGRVPAVSTVVIAVATAMVVWLQPKNLAPAAIVMAVFVVTWGVRTRREQILALAFPVLLTVLSASLLLVFNKIYYGRWLGFPEPTPHFSREGWQLTLGLLFDRDQGLLVQVPWALFGLVGLVAWGWRRMPAAALATLACFLTILFLNGTYTSNPFGGGSMVGRFIWSLIPMCVPWLGLVLARARSTRRSLWPPLVLVTAAFIWQSLPILEKHHNYYNADAAPYRTWSSWWQGLTNWLPQFGRTDHTAGIPDWALPVELGVLAGAAIICLCWARGPGRRVRAG